LQAAVWRRFPVAHLFDRVSDEFLAGTAIRFWTSDPDRGNKASHLYSLHLAEGCIDRLLWIIEKEDEDAMHKKNRGP
jgi:hypothetical protein